MNTIIKSVSVVVMLSVTLALITYSTTNVVVPKPERKENAEILISYNNGGTTYYWVETKTQLTEEEEIVYLDEKKQLNLEYNKLVDRRSTIYIYLSYLVSLVCILLVSFWVVNPIITSGLLLGSVLNLIIPIILNISVIPPLVILLFGIIIFVLSLKLAKSFSKKAK